MPTEVQIYKNGTVLPEDLSTGGPNWDTSGNLTATSFNGTLTGNVTGNVTGSSGSCSGNAASATTFSTGRTNYKGVTDSAVAGQLMWKNYGNSHTIFDASNSTSPDGGAVNNTNSQVVWTATYPTLMGWNGTNTFGVRVDSARVADSAGSAGSVTNGVYTTNFASDFNSKGYQKFPGGFTIQWGNSSTLIGENGSEYQTFKIPFTSAVFSVVATPSSNDPPPGDKKDHWTCFNLSVNGFTLRSYMERGSATYRWIAIGV
jgi:hypothetical protein